jgi:hypothetical protein
MIGLGKCSFFVLLAFVTVPAARGANATSELASLQRSYTKAVREAEHAVGTLETKVTDLRTLRKNRTRLDAWARQILQRAGKNATRKVVLRDIHAEENQKKQDMKNSTSEAKESANALKIAARRVEVASTHAGVSRRVSERQYALAERMSERMEDRVEDLSDDTEDDVEELYEALEHQVNQHFREVAEKSRQVAREEKRKKAAEQVRVAQVLHSQYVQKAHQAIRSLEATDKDLSNKSKNQTFVHALEKNLVQSAGKNASEEAIRHEVQKAKTQKMHEMVILISQAKSAARLVKSSARTVERNSRLAGVKEHEYENAYDEAEHLSEYLEDRSEDVGDSLKNNVKRIYGFADRLVVQQFAEHRRDTQNATKGVAKQPQGSLPGGDVTMKVLATSPTFATSRIGLVACIASALAVFALAMHMRSQRRVFASYPLLG